eukprot:CAMPEP_0170584618 /NCGR_PEP_ID=MMETSP0224-20130122/8779_1 /TAXON_ID=285029 /ORGANISM="Togula jolla, Strain CCCM 725" /LENGTH=359 /DNA_ID=CAMNT_0010908053 /DNA_START=62 /DNA_END=1140 /DNA_ORIENTATION=-
MAEEMGGLGGSSPRGSSAASRRASTLALVGAGAGLAAVRRRALPRIDSHLHLWTPDLERYPCETPPPENLNADSRATHENFVKLMDLAGVSQAVAVQPINYGQDYSYLKAAMEAHPARLKGIFLADADLDPAEAAGWVERIAGSHSGWVGIRFNPYKWPQGSEKGMADDTGLAMFQKAGELGLVVGFMPFKGLSQHVTEVEALLRSSPPTRVIIDHWGFFLQPATGSGDDRTVDEESWNQLLRLSSYPQVFVKISALFRVAADSWPYASLSQRLEQLIDTYGSERLLWGSDFPYVSEHTSYSQAAVALEEWPVWKEIQSRSGLTCSTTPQHGSSGSLRKLSEPRGQQAGRPGAETASAY